MSAMVSQPPRFGVSARLVVVPVTVTGGDGRKIAGLKRDDFRLFEEGKPRDFRVEDVLSPLSLMVAVQVGPDSGPALDKIRKTRSLFEPLLRGHGGEVGLLSYSNEVRLLAPLAGDSYEFDRAFAGLRPKGTGGRMHDAVGESVRLLGERQTGRRRALLLIGEAKDHDSEMPLLRAAEVAQAANVQVYAATYSRLATAFTTREQVRGTGTGVDILGGLRELSRLGSANSAAELTRMTGGMTQSFARLSGLERLLTALSDELHQQYVLSFVPVEGKAGEFRAIRVEVPGWPGAVLRHRPGYWSPSGTA
jgi:VWFA-related protein